MKESDMYDDIINLPHFVSEKRPHMTMLERAAQFNPFSALTGYDDVIEDTGKVADTFKDSYYEAFDEADIKDGYAE